MNRRSFRPAAARMLAAGVLAAGLAVPATASAGVLDSVSGWWPMYEGSGQTVHDLSGKGNNGTLGSTAGVDANDPTWIKGFLFGSALRFDGNDFVRIPDSPALESDKLTVSAWVRSASSPGTNRYIVGKGATGCDSSSYGLFTAYNGGLHFYVTDTTGTFRWSGPVDAGAIWNGKWHHVAGTFDGATAKLFVDGKLIPNPTGGSAHHRLQHADDRRRLARRLPRHLRSVLHGRHRRRVDLQPGAADRQVLVGAVAPVPQAAAVGPPPDRGGGCGDGTRRAASPRVPSAAPPTPQTGRA